MFADAKDDTDGVRVLPDALPLPSLPRWAELDRDLTSSFDSGALDYPFDTSAIAGGTDVGRQEGGEESFITPGQSSGAGRAQTSEGLEVQSLNITDASSIGEARQKAALASQFAEFFERASGARVLPQKPSTPNLRTVKSTSYRRRSKFD
ncbi:hypothetical protein SCHPADRAFT_944058 [Schizopora paradoxa]|uniref:Uncharacterized protein n=1 Tax=Schizopora paradoxa TaxID=27342 RepID=A0A0H2RHG4_9AGAM|nr:hypothetical protein SCHPADRAFT_944058 [Schizopora paradoxa]